MIVWPTDPFSDLLSAEELCSLIDQVMDNGVERPSYPAGIHKHKLTWDSYRDTSPSKVISTRIVPRSDTILLWGYPRMKDEKWVVAVPVGRCVPAPTKSTALCQYMSSITRFYIVNRKTRTFVNMGPKNGCVIDKDTWSQYAPMTKLDTMILRNIRVQSDGSLRVAKLTDLIISKDLPNYGYRVMVEAPGGDPEVAHFGQVNIGLVPLDFSYGTQPRDISLAKAKRANPDLRIDLTQDGLGLSDMDFLLLMHS